MADHNILSKCDQALVAFIISKEAGTDQTIFPAKRSLDKDLPCVICKSYSAAPPAEMPYSGNREVEAQVIVRTPGIAEEDADNTADAPRIAADALVAAVWDCFNIGEGQSGGDLGEAITAAAQGVGVTITVFNAEVIEELAGFEATGDAWTDILHLRLLCAPSAIP